MRNSKWLWLLGMEKVGDGEMFGEKVGNGRGRASRERKSKSEGEMAVGY